MIKLLLYAKIFLVFNYAVVSCIIESEAKFLNKKFINNDLKKYIEENLFPEYQKNDLGHNIEHIKYVINRSFKFADTIQISIMILYILLLLIMILVII